MSPAQSPVKGRPVKLAPCRPGASPRISSGASSGPKLGTGALWPSGRISRFAARKSASRGQSPQFSSGWRGDVKLMRRLYAGCAEPTGFRKNNARGKFSARRESGWKGAASLVVDNRVVWHGRNGRGRPALLEALQTVRAIAGVAADLVDQMDEIDEFVGLPTQFVSDHRRLGGDSREYGDADALALDRLDQRTEV